MTNEKTTSKLSVKDFATMGIFCAIMFVIFMANQSLSIHSMKLERM